jgi:CheY-like chemotaxis protein
MCVLLVEDEPLILLDIAEAIEEAGHEVLPARNGTVALSAIERHPGRFSALVTDHRMPGGIFGSELAAVMRQAYPEIPIIIVTGTPADITPEFQTRHRLKVLSKPYQAGSVIRELPEPKRPRPGMSQ